MLEETLAVWD